MPGPDALVELWSGARFCCHGRLGCEPVWYKFLADESDADGAGPERRRQFIAVSGGGIAILFVLPELEEGDDHDEQSAGVPNSALVKLIPL
jgi:hypothetical protein